jgi:steroid delta-isomerase-like uncharacterized protein
MDNPSMKTPKEVLRKWVDAINNRDAQAVAECYHEDAVNTQIAIGIPINGRDAIYQDLKEFFTAFPDNYTNIENLFEDGEWAILEWSGGGTFSGKMKDMEPTGKKFTLRGCGFFYIPNGKIQTQRGYWDKISWMKQIGIPVN